MIIVALIAIFSTHVYGEALNSLPSPCYAQSKQAAMVRQDMMKQMRDMRPSANAQMQRHTQQQTQGRIDYASQANAMIAPYIARGNSITAAAAGCASVECAANIHSQSSAFLNDITTNLLPKMNAMMADMRREMSNSTAMSVDRMNEIYNKNSGTPMPSSRGGTYFPPLCREFQQIKLSPPSFGWAAFRPPPVHQFKNVRDWNEKNGQGLGAWTCVGSLAMGNVRCFQREKDPQGMGRSCEKAGGQIIACYDNVALWTPISTTSKPQDANWASWFDKPPPLMRVMVGGATMEERKFEEVFKEKEKEIKEMKLVAPLLRPSTEIEGTLQMKDVPLPWEVMEKKILSGKGLSPEDIKNMSDADWDRYRKVKIEIFKESNKSDMERVQDHVGATAGEVKDQAMKRVGDAADWTKQNQEHIESTIDMMENMAYIAGPVGGAAVEGIAVTAKAATVISKMMIVKANDGAPSDYAKELVLLLGPEQLAKLGKKGLYQSVKMGGFDPDKAKQIVEEADKIAEFIDKTSSLKEKK